MVTIFDIKRFAVHDGPGIRTTVFFKGCPLRCGWCHNPESLDMKPVTVEVERKVNGRTVMGKKTYGQQIGEEELMKVLLRDRPFYEESGGGITFSGGEPLMQPAPLVKLLRACQREGLQTAVDTSGHARREVLEQVAEHTGLFLYDLKHMDPGLHERYTGVDNRLILSNADHLLAIGARVIIRVPVIPGINTSKEELERFISFLSDRRAHLQEVHLLPYHRIAGGKYRRLKMRQTLAGVKEPEPFVMEEIRKQFGETGLAILTGG